MAAKTQVGIYLRQSKYHDGSISMELQEEQCRKLAEQRGWDVVGVWRDDDTSGRSTGNRPGLEALRSAYSARKFDLAVAHAVSRFARNMADGATIIGEMPLATVLEGVQDTSKSDLVPLVLMLFAHNQSQEIKKRWREILEYRADQGLPPSGGERYGYTYTPSEVMRDQKLGPEEAYKINEDQAGYVRLMYSWYIQGSGFSTIVSRLHDQGAKTVRGNLWTTTRLLEYMDSGFPAGYFKMGEDLVRGKWDPIISEETWLAYSRRRNARKNESARTKGSAWELQGIARCALCGGPLSRSGRPEKRHARCSRNASSGSASCAGVSYLEVSITEQTAEFLGERLEVWAGELPDDSGERERLTVAIEDYDRQLEDITKEQSRLIDLYVAGELDSDGYKLSKARQDARRVELTEQKQALEDEYANLGPELGSHPLSVNFTRWDTGDNEEAERWQQQQEAALAELARERMLWGEVQRRMEPMSVEERRALYGRMLKGVYVGPTSVRFVAQDGHEQTVPRLAPKKKGVKLSNKAAPGVHGAVRAWAQANGLPVNTSGAVSEALLARWEQETGSDRSNALV